jgi:hypothetical protein
MRWELLWVVVTIEIIKNREGIAGKVQANEICTTVKIICL